MTERRNEVAHTAGVRFGLHLAKRKLVKGPGLLSTGLYLVLGFPFLVIVPLLGTGICLFGVNRLTRRIGQVGTYAWTGMDCLRWAVKNGTILVVGPFVALGILGQLGWDDAGAWSMILFFVLIVVAVWNGIEMRSCLKESRAEEYGA